MLGLLVERGAALDVRDAAGCTPLHLALEAQVLVHKNTARSRQRWKFAVLNSIPRVFARPSPSFGMKSGCAGIMIAAG